MATTTTTITTTSSSSAVILPQGHESTMEDSSSSLSSSTSSSLSSSSSSPLSSSSTTAKTLIPLNVNVTVNNNNNDTSSTSNLDIGNDDDNNDNNNIDFLLEKKRNELQQLRLQRHKEQVEWKESIHELSERYELLNDELHRKLTKMAPTSNASMASSRLYNSTMEYLKEQHYPYLPPLYVLHQEALLLSTMVWTFSILDTQKRMIQRFVESSNSKKYVKAYLVKTRNTVLEQLNHSMHDSVERLSKIAEQNNACYDEYQRQLDEMERKKQKLLKILQEKGDDEQTHLSMSSFGEGEEEGSSEEGREGGGGEQEDKQNNIEKNNQNSSNSDNNPFILFLQFGIQQTENKKSDKENNIQEDQKKKKKKSNNKEDKITSEIPSSTIEPSSSDDENETKKDDGEETNSSGVDLVTDFFRSSLNNLWNVPTPVN